MCHVQQSSAVLHLTAGFVLYSTGCPIQKYRKMTAPLHECTHLFCLIIWIHVQARQAHRPCQDQLPLKCQQVWGSSRLLWSTHNSWQLQDPLHVWPARNCRVLH